MRAQLQVVSAFALAAASAVTACDARPPPSRSGPTSSATSRLTGAADPLHQPPPSVLKPGVEPPKPPSIFVGVAGPLPTKAQPKPCADTCTAGDACTRGCNRCDCTVNGWACTARMCEEEDDNGPCPRRVPRGGQVCGSVGTCRYKFDAGTLVAVCNGLTWSLAQE